MKLWINSSLYCFGCDFSQSLYSIWAAARTEFQSQSRMETPARDSLYIPFWCSSSSCSGVMWLKRQAEPNWQYPDWNQVHFFFCSSSSKIVFGSTKCTVIAWGKWLCWKKSRNIYLYISHNALCVLSDEPGHLCASVECLHRLWNAYRNIRSSNSFPFSYWNVRWANNCLPKKKKNLMLVCPNA